MCVHPGNNSQCMILLNIDFRLQVKFSKLFNYLILKYKYLQPPFNAQYVSNRNSFKNEKNIKIKINNL